MSTRGLSTPLLLLYSAAAPTLLTLVMGQGALEIFVCPTENTLENTKKAAQREEEGGGAGAQKKPSTGLIIYA